jgi:inhibitor of KinA sporulation pathway (predicted exonuclease)
MRHGLLLSLVLLIAGFAHANNKVYSDFDYLVVLDLQATTPLENCGPLVVRETIHYGATLVKVSRNAAHEVASFETIKSTRSFLQLTHTEFTPFMEKYIGVSKLEYEQAPKRDFLEMQGEIDSWVRELPGSFAIVVHGDWFLNSLYVAEYLLRNMPEDSYPPYLKQWISFKTAMAPLVDGKQVDISSLGSTFLNERRLQPDHHLSNDSGNMIMILQDLVAKADSGTLPASVHLAHNQRVIRGIWEFRSDLTPDSGKVYHHAFCTAKQLELPWPLEIKKAGYWYKPDTKQLNEAYTTEKATQLHLHGDKYREIAEKFSASEEYRKRVENGGSPVITEGDVLGFAVYKLSEFIPRVKYFNQQKRQRFRVRIAQDRTITPYSVHGNPIVDGALPADMPMFVLNRGDNGFYVAKKNRNLKGDAKTAIHHSSLLAGADVVAAGRMMIRGGKLEALLFVSGHYKTGSEAACPALNELTRVGVDISEIQLWFKDPNEKDDLKVPFVNGRTYYDANDCAKYKGPIGATLADYHSGTTIHTTRTLAALESVQKRIKSGQKERVFLFADYEATIGCLNEPGNKLREIAECPILAVRERDLLDTHAAHIEPLIHRYVKPRIRQLVSEDFTKLTGITQSLIDLKGKDMQHVFQEIEYKVGEIERQGYEVVFVTYGDWDNAQLVPGQWSLLSNKEKYFPEKFRTWFNVKALLANLGGEFAKRRTRYFDEHPSVRGRDKGEVSQETAIELAGLAPIGQAHSGIDDARNLLQLTKFWIEENGVCLPEQPNGKAYNYKGLGIFDFCYDAQKQEWRPKDAKQ